MHSLGICAHILCAQALNYSGGSEMQLQSRWADPKSRISIALYHGYLLPLISREIV